MVAIQGTFQKFRKTKLEFITQNKRSALGHVKCMYYHLLKLFFFCCMDSTIFVVDCRKGILVFINEYMNNDVFVFFIFSEVMYNGWSVVKI